MKRQQFLRTCKKNAANTGQVDCPAGVRGTSSRILGYLIQENGIDRRAAKVGFADNINITVKHRKINRRSIMTSRRSYDKQFKERAVKLYLRGDKTQKAIA